MRFLPRRHAPHIRYSLAWLLVAFTAAVLYVAWHAHSVRQSDGVGIERPSDAGTQQRR